MDFQSNGQFQENFERVLKPYRAEVCELGGGVVAGRIPGRERVCLLGGTQGEAGSGPQAILRFLHLNGVEYLTRQGWGLLIVPLANPQGGAGTSALDGVREELLRQPPVAFIDLCEDRHGAPRPYVWDSPLNGNAFTKNMAEKFRMTLQPWDGLAGEREHSGEALARAAGCQVCAAPTLPASWELESRVIFASKLLRWTLVNFYLYL